jgi:hypothetical protein
MLPNAHEDLGAKGLTVKTASRPAALTLIDLDTHVRAIKELLVKLGEISFEAEEIQREIGERIRTIKLATPCNWEAIVKTRCGISRSRAYELMGIAEGVTTTAQVRGQTNARKIKYRQKQVVRSGTDDEGEEESELALIEAKPVPVDPLAVWNALPSEQKKQILDHEGRVGLAALMSPALLADLTDHLIKLQVSVASDAGPLAVQLTKMLRRALSGTDAAVAATLEQMYEKLNSNGRGIHDVIVALVDNRKKMKQRSNKSA